MGGLQMSYPPARHHGEGGEVSARIRLHDAKPEIEQASGGAVHYLTTGASTGGVHAFKNQPGEAASMLLLFAPGADREECFETLAKIGHGLQLTDGERTSLYERHDNHWL
jgi:hypothetical protein